MVGAGTGVVVIEIVLLVVSGNVLAGFAVGVFEASQEVCYG